MVPRNINIHIWSYLLWSPVIVGFFLSNPAICQARALRRCVTHACWRRYGNAAAVPAAVRFSWAAWWGRAFQPLLRRTLFYSSMFRKCSPSTLPCTWYNKLLCPWFTPCRCCVPRATRVWAVCAAWGWDALKTFRFLRQQSSVFSAGEAFRAVGRHNKDMHSTCWRIWYIQCPAESPRKSIEAILQSIATVPHYFQVCFVAPPPQKAGAVLKGSSAVHVYMHRSSMQIFRSVVIFVSYAYDIIQHRMP